MKIILKFGARVYRGCIVVVQFLNSHFPALYREGDERVQDKLPKLGEPRQPRIAKHDNNCYSGQN